jgi:hypothetical protein
MIMFGNDQRSCTTSDNVTSLGSYLYSSGIGNNQNLNVVKEGEGYGMSWGEAPLEYNFEEIKQLLNCNYTLCNTPSISNSAINSIILPDDPVEGLKPEGKMYQF